MPDVPVLPVRSIKISDRLDLSSTPESEHFIIITVICFEIICVLLSAKLSLYPYKRSL